MKPQNNKVISFDSFTQELQANSSLGVFDITFPSLGKTYSFKQLTVGQQRSISKNSADIKNKVAQIENRIKLLGSLCQDTTFDPYAITYPEFIMAMAYVRENNFGDEVDLTYVCPNEECKMHVPVKLNMADIIARLEEECSKLNEEWDWSFKAGDNEITFILSYPSVKDYLAMTKLFASRAQDKLNHNKDKDVNSIDFSAENEDTALAFLYSYIKGIKLNGALVDMTPLNEMSISDRVNFFETQLKFDLLKFVKSINEKISNIIEVTKIVAVCPKCKNKIETVVDIDSFFQL